MHKLAVLLVTIVSTAGLAAAPSAINPNPATRPSARTGPMTDSNRAATELIYTFGGNALTFNNQLWAYDVGANTWTQVADTNPPSARSWGRASFDEAQARLIVFGGSEGLNGPLLNEVWSFNPATNAWTQLVVSGAAPSPRFAHDLHYIPHLGRHLLFGGGTSTSSSAAVTAVDAQLWLLNVNAAAGTASWQQLTPTGNAPARASVCSGYDRVRRRLVIFGGETPTDVLGDTLQYDVATNAWITDSPTGDVPSKRGAAVCSFDERTGRLMMYGGVTSVGGNPISAAYTYDPVTQVWSNITFATSPGNITSAQGTYSPQLGRMLWFGGRSGTLSHSQALWTIRLNARPTVSATTGSTVNENSAVTLSATGADSDGDALTYAWTQLTGPTVTLSNASTATPTFTAPTVTAATGMSFRVTVNDGLETATATLSLTVADAANVLPVAGAGSAFGVVGGANVQLNGTASDPDNSTPLAFSWTQTAGPAVALNGANTLTPSFTAPTVTACVDLSFRLSVTDSRGGSADASVVVTLYPSVLGSCTSGNGNPPSPPVSPLLEAQCATPLEDQEGMQPLMSGTGPFLYSAEPAAGQTLPPGLSVDASSGAVRWTPTRESVGSHRIVLKVSSPSGSSTRVVEINVFCPREQQLQVGCSAGGSWLASAWAGAALIALVAGRRRRSASPRV